MFYEFGVEVVGEIEEVDEVVEDFFVGFEYEEVVVEVVWEMVFVGWGLFVCCVVDFYEVIEEVFVGKIRFVVFVVDVRFCFYEDGVGVVEDGVERGLEDYVVVEY